jgi:hypothetical protein
MLHIKRAQVSCILVFKSVEMTMLESNALVFCYSEQGSITSPDCQRAPHTKWVRCLTQSMGYGARPSWDHLLVVGHWASSISYGMSVLNQGFSLPTAAMWVAWVLVGMSWWGVGHCWVLHHPWPHPLDSTPLPVVTVPNSNSRHCHMSPEGSRDKKVPVEKCTVPY